MKRQMSKGDFARLITTFIQSQVGVRELGTRPMICVPGVFFSMRSRVNIYSKNTLTLAGKINNKLAI